VFCAFPGAQCWSSPRSDVVQTTVIYPASEAVDDSRHNDLVEILDTALKKTVAEYGSYRCIPSTVRMNEKRSLYELKLGQIVNVVWSSTSVEIENELTPIRVPLRKGLLGVRIALINEANQPQIDSIKTLADLQKVTLGQGIGWIDLDLLQYNGLQVVSSSYDSLFEMANHNRFLMFPRGLPEVFDEYEPHKAANPNLAIEKNLIIFYPWPYYFFVNNNNPQLAARLNLGLQRMIADGSFNQLFWKYNGHAIQSAHLDQRRIIRLDNPILPKATPADDRYWFFPHMIRNDASERFYEDKNADSESPRPKTANNN
jgi:ABC-type amino acid transport substrate-binding protein